MVLAPVCDDFRIYFLLGLGFLGATRFNEFFARRKGGAVWLEVRRPERWAFSFRLLRRSGDRRPAARGRLQYDLPRAIQGRAAERRRHHARRRSAAAVSAGRRRNVDTGGGSAPKAFSFFGSSAPPPAAPQTTGSQEVEPAEGGYTLNFENAPISQVAKSVLGDILGLGYVIDPRAQGTISLSSGPADRQERHALCARERAERQQSGHDPEPIRLPHRARQ